MSAPRERRHGGFDSHALPHMLAFGIDEIGECHHRSRYQWEVSTEGPRPAYVLAAALAAWAITAAIWILLAPPLRGDEPTYAILARGDGPLWLYRSRGIVAIARLGIEFGASDRAMRITSAVLGLGMPLSVYAYGRVLAGPRTGAWAAAVVPAVARPVVLRACVQLLGRSARRRSDDRCCRARAVLCRAPTVRATGSRGAGSLAGGVAVPPLRQRARDPGGRSRRSRPGNARSASAWDLLLLAAAAFPVCLVLFFRDVDPRHRIAARHPGVLARHWRTTSARIPARAWSATSRAIRCCSTACCRRR